MRTPIAEGAILREAFTLLSTENHAHFGACYPEVVDPLSPMMDKLQRLQRDTMPGLGTRAGDRLAIVE